MKKNNFDDFSLNLWLAITIVSPILEYCYYFFFNEFLSDQLSFTGSIITIAFSLVMSLPILFLLRNISRKLFQTNLFTWQIRIIIAFIVMILILGVAILLFNSYFIFPIIHGKYKSHILIFNLFYFSRFYLLIGFIAVFFLKINREEPIRTSRSHSDILDERI